LHFFIAAVIAILIGELALGRVRVLPSARLFSTAHLAILVIYLVLAVLLFTPPLLMILGVPIAGALLLAYVALGSAQATAIAAGLEEWRIGSWRAWPLALLLAYLPVVGSAVAVQGATMGWGWSRRTGLMRFFGPLFAILARRSCSSRTRKRKGCLGSKVRFPTRELALCCPALVATTFCPRCGHAKIVAGAVALSVT
jgi:hypothetical protein